MSIKSTFEYQLEKKEVLLFQQVKKFKQLIKSNTNPITENSFATSLSNLEETIYEIHEIAKEAISTISC